MISENSYNNLEEINQNTKVSYLDYSELSDFDTSNELILALKNIKIYLTDVNADWVCQFESINDLRKLNKYQPKIFLETFHEISADFVKLIISIRSNIAKLCLILLKEFFANRIYFVKNFSNENNNIKISNLKQNFSNTKNLASSNSKSCKNPRFSELSSNSNFAVFDKTVDNINIQINKNSRISEQSNFSLQENFNNYYVDLISYSNTINSIFDIVIPYVLQQSCTMKAFLKEEANKCLENVSIFTQSFVFLKKINLQINNKNSSYSENAFLTAMGLLDSLFSQNSDFLDFNNPTNKSLQNIKEIMEINIRLFNLKKDVYAKKAIKMLAQLKLKIGDELFEIVKSNFDNVSKNTIDNMIKEGNKGIKTNGNFKEFLKSKK